MEKIEKIYYFDDDGNMVSKEEATNGIIRITDKDGMLIEERFVSYKNEEDYSQYDFWQQLSNNKSK